MKTYYSCAELAALKVPDFPVAKKNWIALVIREAWESRPRGKRGGGSEYAPPPAVLRAIRKQEQIIAAVENPGPMRRVMKQAIETVNALNDAEEKARDARQSRAEKFLRESSGISDRDAASLKAHCEISEFWAMWFTRNQPLKRSKSWAPFATAYGQGEVPVSKEVREAYPKFSPRSIQRWVLDYEKENFAALVDHRNGDAKRGKNVFAARPLLAAYAKKLMIERPGIKTGFLYGLLETASIDKETGEILFDPPSYNQVHRFQKSFVEANSELYLQQTNPDAWKNKAMVAYGDASEDVIELNQRWEMDATPADWILVDPNGEKRRYTVSCVIDIYSRRALVVVARTPKTQTHCYALRQALLTWGVPKAIVTDNGADYQSHHFRRVLNSLGIEHRTTNPFSGEEKPHIERFIGTLNLSILELLPNFVGHNVAERKAIEARKSFAERLARKGEIVDFADVVDGSCSGEFLLARIKEWLLGVYEQREHRGLKTSPFLRAAGWTGKIRQISDERCLDVLLSRPAGQNGRRTLQKKGILLDGAWFISSELARIQTGHLVDVYETEDLGRIIVHYEGDFACVAECPERTGIDRAEIAAKAEAIQKERLREERRRLKEETKNVPDTNALVAQHLREKAAKAGQLVLAPFGATEYRSHGLEQAERATRALDGVPGVADGMIVAGKFIPAGDISPNPKVIQLDPHARKSRTEMKPEENYADWKVIDRRIADGLPVSNAEAFWHQSYQKSSQYKALKRMNG
jgi:transposase InsO family protein